MNHYGVARECSAIYDVNLKPLADTLPKSGKSKASSKSRLQSRVVSALHPPE